jgi:hypothetical protein
MARPRTVQLEALFDSLPAAASEILQTDTHTLMDVQRFDRTVDVLGRLGFVSLLTQGWVDRYAQAAMGRLHASAG